MYTRWLTSTFHIGWHITLKSELIFFKYYGHSLCTLTYCIALILQLFVAVKINELRITLTNY